MKIQLEKIDHIVLCVADVSKTRAFYERVLGMESREERPGKYSLHFGDAKISLQDASTVPDIAKDTVAGSGNFCLITSVPLDRLLDHLVSEGVEIRDGPGQRSGAVGDLLSVYFNDPDGNLVEVSNRL